MKTSLFRRSLLATAGVALAMGALMPAAQAQSTGG